jgi:hypothetical protein
MSFLHFPGGYRSLKRGPITMVRPPVYDSQRNGATKTLLEARALLQARRFDPSYEHPLVLPQLTHL